MNKPVSRRKRVLVAGAAGFVGSHLCERLIAEGYEVIGIDNLLTGRMRNLEGLQREPRFTCLERDILDPIPLLGELDWVFHLASPASPPAYQKHAVHCLRTNSEGTIALLERALQAGARFFLASTSEVYGDPMVHPQAEGYWGNVNPNGPRSVYDEGKRFAESSVCSYHRRHGIPVRIVRIFNTYGPRMAPDDGRVVSNFVCQALRRRPMTVYGDGTQTRSFQYVDDLIEGMLRLSRVDYAQPVNLGNPTERSILELVGLLEELVGYPLEVTFGALPVDDPSHRRPDIALARRLLRWEPRVDLRQGLLRTIQHFAQELELRPSSGVAAAGLSLNAQPLHKPYPG